MKTKRILSVIVAVLLLMPVFALHAFAIPAPPSAAFTNELMSLVIAERAKKDLPALAIDASKLRSAAVVRADESAVKFDIVGHKRPSGNAWYTVLAENGVTHFNGAGETLAAGYDTPAEVVAAWMNNAQDRANILNPDFTHVGIGIYEGTFKLGDDPQEGYVVALLFITESKNRHPSADNALQAFLRQIDSVFTDGWNSFILRLINWFNGLLP